MKRICFALVALALACPPAQAHNFDLGLEKFGNWLPKDHLPGDWLDLADLPKLDHFPFRGHMGGFESFGPAPFGLGHFGFPGLDPERLQTRFEDRFDKLMSEYEMGMADVDNYFQSEDYMDIVDDTKVLTDRYDWFLSGAIRQIERLGDTIDYLNDDVMHYMDLITEYESRDDLPQRYLDRVLMRLSNTKEYLNTKIDWLTDKQTMLSEDLPTYEMFSSELSMWLEEILGAGEVPVEAEPVSLLPLTTVGQFDGFGITSPIAATGSGESIDMNNSVPEPSAALVLGTTGVFLAVRRRRTSGA